MEQPYCRSNRIAIRRGSDQPESNRSIAVAEVVSEEHGRSVVGGHQQIYVSVSVEVGGREATSDSGLGEGATREGSGFPEGGVPLIDEEQRRLGVTDVAADISDGVIDMAVWHHPIRKAIEAELCKAAR